jgi:hypothetical protein
MPGELGGILHSDGFMGGLQPVAKPELCRLVKPMKGARQGGLLEFFYGRHDIALDQICVENFKSAYYVFNRLCQDARDA